MTTLGHSMSLNNNDDDVCELSGCLGDERKPKINKFRVLDANVFIRCGGLQSLLELTQDSQYKLVTCRSIIEELKSRQSRNNYESLMPFIELHTIPKDILDYVISFSKSSSDFDNLSQSDIEIIGLTVYLSKKCCLEHQNRQLKKFPQKSKTKTHNQMIIPGFYDPDRINRNKKQNSDYVENNEDLECWIKPLSLRDKSTINENESKTAHVACITGDFDIQNVLLKMDLCVIDLDKNQMIEELKYYATLCRYCGLINRHSNEKFCQHCGKKGLTKIPASLSRNGNTKLHLSKKFNFNKKKSFGETLQRFQGGKHPNMEPLSKGHRVAQQKLPKSKSKNLSKSGQTCTIFGQEIFSYRNINTKAFKNGIK